MAKPREGKESGGVSVSEESPTRVVSDPNDGCLSVDKEEKEEAVQVFTVLVAVEILKRDCPSGSTREKRPMVERGSNRLGLSREKMRKREETDLRWSLVFQILRV